MKTATTALPMRRSGIGSLEQLDAATLADARAFHEAFYGPDTATLIVSGNFDQRRLDMLIDRYFAAIPRRANPIPLKVTATEAPRTIATHRYRLCPQCAAGDGHVVVAHPRLRPPRPRRSRGARGGALERRELATVSRAGPRQPDRIVGRRSAAGRRGRRLLRADRDAGQWPHRCRGRARLAAEIARVRDEPVTAAELAEAKNEILAAALRSRETFDGRAFAIGEALVRTGDPRALDRRLALVGKVTAADVQRVARLYLKPQARVDVRYLDEKLRPAGDTESWANPTAMPIWASVPAAQRPRSR